MRRLAERCLRLATQPLSAHDGTRLVEVIVVLGAPPTKEGELSPIMRERVEYAVKLYQDKVSEFILMSGGVTEEGYVEATMMADHARSLGVPAQSLIEEPRSASTRENARESAVIMKRRAWRSAWVVSQPFHLGRARRNFRQVGVDAFANAPRESIQYKYLRLGARCVFREYAAWALELLRPTPAQIIRWDDAKT